MKRLLSVLFVVMAVVIVIASVVSGVDMVINMPSFVDGLSAGTLTVAIGAGLSGSFLYCAADVLKAKVNI